MKFLFQFITIVLGTGRAAAHQGSDAVTPVQKVVQLLDGMAAKGKQEKHDEEVQFAAYKQFCDDTSVEKTRAIDKANEQIQVHKASIEKHAADAARLKREISEH